MSWLGWSLELRGNHITQPLMLRLRQGWAVWASGQWPESSPVPSPTCLMFSVTLGAGLEAQWWTSWSRCHGRFRVARWLLGRQVHSRGTRGILGGTGS